MAAFRRIPRPAVGAYSREVGEPRRQALDLTPREGAPLALGFTPRARSKVDGYELEARRLCFRPGRLIMSNDPAAPPRGDKVRWVITGCLLGLAVLCVGWIVFLKTSGAVASAAALSPLSAPGPLVPAIAALDVLALIGLGVWVLRTPAPGALGFFGRWLGKVLLFLGLGAAIVVFFFATCLVVPAL